MYYEIAYMLLSILSVTFYTFLIMKWKHFLISIGAFSFMLYFFWFFSLQESCLPLFSSCDAGSCRKLYASYQSQHKIIFLISTGIGVEFVVLLQKL